MKKAFLTLYVLIVVTIIVIGWGLDKIWEAYNPENTTRSTEERLLDLIEMHFNQISDEQLSIAVTKLNELEEEHVELISLDEIANTPQLNRLLSGETIQLTDRNDNYLLYKKLKSHPFVVSLKVQDSNNHTEPLQTILILLFYFALAVAVFLWVWPLSRDLHKLEKHTQYLASSTLDKEVHIQSRSPAYTLARAYNRMASRISQLLKSHQEMTHAVSHEIRTPLARMKFALEMLSGNNDLKQMKSELESIGNDVVEIETLVNALLNYASIEQSDSKLSIQEGDMHSLIIELIARIQRHKSRQPKIHFNDLTHDGKVECDWYLMERAITNLLQNAVRFASEQVTLTLSKDSEKYQITVEDDGSGVPVAEQARIFESFVRLNNAVNAENSGFGLGLAIVKRVAQWHDGNVIFEESEHGGALFRITWPNSAKCSK